VLQVQVDRDKGENHQKIFLPSLCSKLNPNILTSDHMVLLKCVENQELLLSMYK